MRMNKKLFIDYVENHVKKRKYDIQSLGHYTLVTLIDNYDKYVFTQNKMNEEIKTVDEYLNEDFIEDLKESGCELKLEKYRYNIIEVRK